MAYIAHGMMKKLAFRILKRLEKGKPGRKRMLTRSIWITNSSDIGKALVEGSHPRDNREV
jgi:hypothetical protein